MNRRKFMALLAGSVPASRTIAHAQAGDRSAHIGALMGYTAGDFEGERFIAAFEQGLRALGWTPGHNLRIDYRWGGGEAERFQAHAAELVAASPRAIFAHSSNAVRAVAQQTKKVPVVFAHVADPLGQGFVASLARPGGNITGFTNFELKMGEKWLETLKEASPDTVRVAVVYNPHTAPYFVSFWEALTSAAKAFSIQLINAPAREVADIDAAMALLRREPGGGIIVIPDVFASMNRSQIVALAAHHRLPAVYPLRFFASGGGLMSYGADASDIFRRAAGYIDRILKGANPGELPVQTPTKFELVVNLKAAKALGLDLPPLMVARADEVIE
jgi:putative tryptophan/tyrosine transport system substrate-binding protein